MDLTTVTKRGMMQALFEIFLVSEYADTEEGRQVTFLEFSTRELWKLPVIAENLRRILKMGWEKRDPEILEILNYLKRWVAQEGDTYLLLPPTTERETQELPVHEQEEEEDDNSYNQSFSQYWLTSEIEAKISERLSQGRMIVYQTK